MNFFVYLNELFMILDQNLGSQKMCTNAPSTSMRKEEFDFNSNIFKGFMASGLAAIISKTTVAPIDRIKLILQLQNGQQIVAVNGATNGLLITPQYNGIVDCCRKLCMEQGVVSLWRGNVASVVSFVILIIFMTNRGHTAFPDFSPFRIKFPI